MAGHYRLNTFRDFLNVCCLTNVESKCCAFTLANNQDGDEHVKKKLDRVVCKGKWKIMYPKAEAFAIPTIGFDHNPIFLSLSIKLVKRKKKF